MTTYPPVFEDPDSTLASRTKADLADCADFLKSSPEFFELFMASKHPRPNNTLRLLQTSLEHWQIGERISHICLMPMAARPCSSS